MTLVRCPRCEGLGDLWVEWRPGVACPECDGAGRIPDRRRSVARPTGLMYVLLAAMFVAGLIGGLLVSRVAAAPRSAFPIPAALTPAGTGEPDLWRRTGALHESRPDAGVSQVAEETERPAFRSAPPRPTVAPAALTSVSGTASWHATGRDGPFAAAGPALRLGNWRGRVVTVTGPAGTLVVTLNDWCQCYAGTSRERVIDLSDEAFRRVCGALSQGLCVAGVAW